MKEYLSVKDIQDELGLPKNTVYKLVKINGFPAVRIGKRYVVQREKFYCWMDKYSGKSIDL